ncbi:MAG TPA: hypothetical protein VFV27_00105 [Nevskiaceae bacterium]|nr:hypothetical protein [Nevskiaceae bacterium]
MLAALLLQAALGSAPLPAWTATASGLGPLRLGMYLAEAARASQLDWVERHESAPCHYAYPGGDFSRLGLMLVDGRIERIEVLDPALPTRSGLRVGDPLARIEALYGGRYRQEPRPDGAPGAWYRLFPADPQQLVIETDGRAVQRYWISTAARAGYARGCLDHAP